MQGYILTISFKGTEYCGWQVQKNARSVQKTLQNACERVFNAECPVTGCSRTDAGVHAKGFVALAGAENTIPEEALPLALNSCLPDDISVLSAEYTEKDFHPRYDASGKEYIYTIYNSQIRDPFTADFCWQVKKHIDEKALFENTRCFVGRHDFRAFMASGSKIEDTVRTVSYFDVKRDGDRIYLSVCADGFLYNMVRIMAGTAVDSVTGSLSMPINEILLSLDRKNAGITAPAKGLCLNRVFYGKEK